MPSQQSSATSASTSHSKLRKRKWTREQLLKSLEILGPLTAPLPPDLPPSPPLSRSNSPAPPATKRKHEYSQDSDVAKRPRISNVSDTSLAHSHHYLHPPPPPPPPQLHRSSNQAVNFNLRSEPSEDGELKEETTSPFRPSALPVLPSAVPVRRPRRGKSDKELEAIHNTYHSYGRMLKYSGDARFWSTYPSTHREYRPLADPPPPNSPYHKYGALIARLELVDALLCFTYSLWSRDYSKNHCFRETWATIEAFLGWCKNKWTTEDTFGDREKALLGLIWMIEGFIRARKVFYATKTIIDPELDRTWSKMKSDMAALAREAEKAEMSGGTAGQLTSLGSQTTPPMLPSPASIAPANSANSTPITSSSSAGGTPSTGSGASSTTLVASQSSGSSSSTTAPRPPHSGPLALPPHLVAHVPHTADGRAPTPGMINAASKAHASLGPMLMLTLREQATGITSAAYCMEHAQRYLTLPIMARHYPMTFARMIGTSLAAHEEHEPDIEDTEGELFWPGQCVGGEGIGWVCLMGKAMVREIGREYGYVGLEGVVEKPGGFPSVGSPYQGSGASRHR